ncbi:MAG: hypothetical protein R3E78_00765 [Burkholderiaceae bacterium]
MADDELGGWAIPAPAFKADEALVALKRQLRDLKPLAERGTRYELQGRTVIELAAGDDHIEARLAKRPATTPEWQRHRLASAADLRRFVDMVRQALRRWEHED